MNNINHKNNILDLQQRHANLTGMPDHLGELLKLVRGIALKHLQKLVNTLFENIDDALFDLAEKAENNVLQARYFDGMRDVRKKRQLVQRTFQEQLSLVFNDFAAGKLQRKTEGANKQSGELTLVDDTELDESLAIASTVAKAENRLALPLFAVNERLSLIRGGVKIEDANNPIAPAPLCQAFRLAIRTLDLNDQSRLIIYKLFDRYVMSGLGALYDEVNAQLIQAGVLPQIRHSVPQSRGSAPRLMPTPVSSVVDGGQEAITGQMADAGYPIDSQHHDPVAALLQTQIHNTLRSLLASRRMMASGGEQTAPEYLAIAPSIAPTDLLSALTLLQTQAMIAPTRASSATGAVQIVQQIKQELLDQVGKFHGSKKAHVAGVDEDTIDLVGMLFEFILQDRNLLPQMQALLSRLQIPFLKVALLDRHLFAQKTHPARQLLDSLAQACMGWSEESDSDHRLHDKVKQMVESLLKDFDDDLGIFDRTRAEFESFLESNKKRANLAEQRAAEATRGCERLHAARRISAREILKCIAGKQLPQLVHNVLTRPWANYMVLTLLRQGEDSHEWRRALRFADQFVWSAQAKTSDAERTRLQGLMPALEKSLRHGLAAVAYDESDISQLMRELNAFYGNSLSDGSPVVGQQSSSPASAHEQGTLPFELVGKAAATAAAVDSAVEEIVMRGDVQETAPEANYAHDDACLKQAREIQVGTWVEFTDADSGAKVRAKLSWISPISSKYLFVNRKGHKVSDKTMFALAAEIRRGAAVVLAEVPLFDRALDAIVARLKATQAPAKAEVAAVGHPLMGVAASAILLR